MKNNNRRTSEPQEALFNHLTETLGEGFEMEHRIDLRQHKAAFQHCLGWRGDRLYVDIAHPEKKLAIEVDGKDHRSTYMRQRDENRDIILEALGWNVTHFTNDEALQLWYSSRNSTF